MKAQKDGAAKPRKKIADEILKQIGKSVLPVFVIVAVVAIVMVWSTIISSQKQELMLESESVMHELTGFLEKYAKVGRTAILYKRH